MGVSIIRQRGVARVRPGTAMEEQLQLKRIGRVHRDGQTEPVMAYFLLSDSGSDPIVSDVLGVKREQIEGVRSPGEHLVERLDVGENQLRALAQQFLQQQGAAQETTNVTTMETSR